MKGERSPRVSSVWRYGGISTRKIGGLFCGNYHPCQKKNRTYLILCRIHAKIFMLILLHNLYTWALFVFFLIYTVISLSFIYYFIFFLYIIIKSDSCVLHYLSIETLLVVDENWPLAHSKSRDASLETSALFSLTTVGVRCFYIFFFFNYIASILRLRFTPYFR